VFLAEALGEALGEVWGKDLAAFCAETTDFLAATGFRAFSLSAAKLGSDIKAKMHKGKQGLKTRQENRRFSGFKAILSRLKVIWNLASAIETHDSVPK
jgi:hypothetical protein